MPGTDEWCNRTPHLEGEEVFVSFKRNPSTTFGGEHESHKLDKISISRPRIQTRSACNDSDPSATSVAVDSPTTSDGEDPLLLSHQSLLQ